MVLSRPCLYLQDTYAHQDQKVTVQVTVIIYGIFYFIYLFLFCYLFIYPLYR